MVTHRNALQAGHKLHWYEIISILGQGGFAITYLASDPNLDQLVAIKEFLPIELAVRDNDSSLHPLSDGHSDTYGWGLSRFLSEAQTLARFRHPNIVRVLSVFEANNTAYMVMEYEQGKSLEDALKFRRIEGQETLLGLLFPLLDGLALVHEAGFIHRDIKPDNIYLREDGVPVLLDFGSARQALGVATRTLTTLVSPGYAPFEQYNATRDSDRQGPWTDIYSLGATLYRAVSGKGPPDAIARANAALEGKQDPMVAALQLEPEGYSSAFLEAVDISLSFLPEKRPQSIDEWRGMFPQERFSSSTSGRIVASASAPPTTKSAEAETRINDPKSATGPRTAQTTSSRRKWLVATGVFGVVLAAALGGYLLRSSSDHGVGVRAPVTDESLTADTPEVVAEVTPAEVVTETATTSSVLETSKEALSSLSEQLSELEAQHEQPSSDAVVELQTEIADESTDAQPDLAAVNNEVLKQQQEEEARRQQEEEERQAEAERQKMTQLAAQREQEEAEGKALEEQMALEAKRQAEEAEREAQAERDRTKQLAEELAALETSRRQQTRIDELLALAEIDLEASRLTTPAGNNALQRYRGVLEIENNNAVALEGLQRIVVRYLQLADRAKSKGQFDKARAFLTRSELVLPDSPMILAAVQSIDLEEEQFFDRQRQAQDDADRKALEDRQRREREEAEKVARQDEELKRIQQELARLKAEAELKEQLKQQLEEQVVAAAVPQPEVATPQFANPSRLAIFPIETNRICYFPRGLELRQAVARIIQNERRLTLSYSYYSDDAETSAGGGGPKTTLVWQRCCEDTQLRTGLPGRRTNEDRWCFHGLDEMRSQRKA